MKLIDLFCMAVLFCMFIAILIFNYEAAIGGLVSLGVLAYLTWGDSDND